jgi:hypothetical protein
MSTLSPSPTKQLPEYRVLAYGRRAFGDDINEGAAVHDILRGLVRPNGDATGSSQFVGLDGLESASESLGGVDTTFFVATSLLSKEWRQPSFESISPTIEYIDLSLNVGTGAEASSNPLQDTLSGFYLRPRALPVNLKMPTAMGDPTGNPKVHTEIGRQTKPSTGSYFETVQSFDSRVTQVQLRVPLPNKTAEVVLASLKKNQQFRVSVRWIERSHEHATQAGCRLRWGKSLSIVAREDAKGQIMFSLERMERGEWVTIRRFEEAALSKWEGETVIAIERIAGRLVVGIGANKFAVLDYQSGITHPEEHDVREFSWEAGKLYASCFGVRARFGLELLMHTDGKGRPLKGEFSRFAKRSLPPRSYTFQGGTAGWGDTSMKREVTGTALPQGIHYICSLEASVDGISSPFVSVVTGHCGHPRTPLGMPTPLDISPAFLSGEMDESSPEANRNGVTLSLKVSRNLLLDIAKKQGVDYRDFLCQFAVVTFEVRWGMSDGTHTPWIGRLFYVEDENLSNPSPNQFDADLRLIDPTMRLTKPHSCIDHRFLRDMGWLVALRSFEGNGGLGTNLYGGDCVKYLIETEMGPSVSETLNGNGDPLRFFTEGHAPLVSVSNDRLGYVLSTKPPTQNAEIVPVTWGNGVVDEIKKIAGIESACFFWEHIPDTIQGDIVGYPVPVYADWRQWVANMPTWDIYDSDGYEGGDTDLIIRAIELSRRGNAVANRALVWTKTDNMPTNHPYPATLMAQARFSADDPNSRENIGWDITFIKEENKFAYFPEAIPIYAAKYLERLRGVKIQWPHVTIRGDMRIKWGHKVRLHMRNDGAGAKYSDTSMGLDGQVFRVLKATHTCVKEKMGPDSFTTKLSLFPILNGEV